MIREAELFVQAEDVLVEVVGRVRQEHWRITVPPMYDMPGADQPATIRRLVERYVRDDAWVPDMLAGRTMDQVGVDRYDGDLLGTDPARTVRTVAEAAATAVRKVDDGEQVVHCSFGDISTSLYLWQLDIARCFLAHQIAMHLGSRACPLTEELARGMYEGTIPQAEQWRSWGVYRTPITPVPADVSWRDKYLMAAGVDPHPLDH